MACVMKFSAASWGSPPDATGEAKRVWPALSWKTLMSTLRYHG